MTADMRQRAFGGGFWCFFLAHCLLMIVGAGVITYWVAVRSANDAYDRSLLDPALDIVDNIRIDATGARVDLPQKALGHGGTRICVSFPGS